ncbi:MAG: FoF1 ATP synthase subunit delta/epsilon [Planctomycetota bacterium]|jgi:F0F1-type ATP synthase epsilon subunit
MQPTDAAMDTFSKLFEYEVLTPSGPACSGQCSSAVLPTGDGRLGVLAGRSAMVSTLKAGALTVTAGQGQAANYFIVGGFARMEANQLHIFTDECTLADELDAHAVWEELQVANRLPAETPEQVAHREQARAEAREKFRLAQRFGQVGIF